MTRTRLLLAVLLCACARAEVHTLSLRQAVELALKQNPDLVIARLDQQKAEAQVRIARDPFIPKLYVGSGLAYSSGIPMSVEGSAPSIFQARVVTAVFNRPQSYLLAQARENARGATLDAQAGQEEVVLRTVDLYLRTEEAARAVGLARRQLESAEKVVDLVRLRVAEGRELPLEERKARLEEAKWRQRAESLAADEQFAEAALAAVLGFAAGDRVRAAAEQRMPPELPPSEDAAVAEALRDNREVRRLESALVAKGFEIRARQAARLPQLDLVAQYATLGRFNNYEDFFKKFQRNNTQLGVSIQVPVFQGQAVKALLSQAEAGAARLRLELSALRSRLDQDARRSFLGVRKAETAREVAKLELEVARETLTVLMARLEEGRVTLREVEEARQRESESWLGYYAAQTALERARFVLLRRTGGLLAALR